VFLEANPSEFQNEVSTIMLTTLATSDGHQNSPVDIWMHPRIPRIRGWKSIDVGLKADSTIRFSLPYEYVFMDCKQYMRASNEETLEFFHTVPKLDISPKDWPQDQGGFFNRSLWAGKETVYVESNLFSCQNQWLI
jgi:hypothetical protein